MWNKYATEEELALDVENYLKYSDPTAEVFKEVSWQGKRADFVVLKTNKTVFIIECKLSCSEKLFIQATYWLGKVNGVFVATPVYPGIMARAVCEKYGIGFLFLDKSYQSVSEVYAPRINYKAKNLILKNCFEENKKIVSGTQNTMFTPFKKTASNIIRIIKEHNGIIEYKLLLKLITENSLHHYRTPSTAKRALYSAIKYGYIDNIKFHKDSGRLFVICI